MDYKVEVRGFGPSPDDNPLDVDEFVVEANGECVFVLETMNDDCVWMAAYWPGSTKRVSFHAMIVDGKIVVRVQDDFRTPEEKENDVNPPPGGKWEW